MADRQYGIPPGYGYPRPAYAGHTGTRTPISPISHNGSMASLSRDYAPSAPISAPSTAPSSPRRRPAQPDEAPPVPQHRQGPPSPDRYRPRPGGAAPPVDNSSPAVDASLDSHFLDFQALRGIDNLYGGRMMSPSPELDEPYHNERPHGQPSANNKSADYRPAESLPLGEPKVLKRPQHQPANSQSSVVPLLPPEAHTSPPRPAAGRRRRSIPVVDAAGYAAGPYGQVRQGDGYDDQMHPDDIADDGDEDIETFPRHQRHSRRSMGAAAGIGRRPTSRDRNADADHEKSEWLSQHSHDGKRKKKVIFVIIACVVLAAIIGGAVGGVLASKKSSDTKSTSSASSTSDDKGLYDINSPQVKALLNNQALHKVFPGMDYTPLNAQYPACLTVGPDQNNITLDIAMLSQLAPAVRLYGTDCNQTEMVLAAIDRLGYNDTVKVWLGVWLENNATTNTRQLQQMYDILDTYPSTHFAGVIVGNEVLFRKDLTETGLGQQLQNVRNNLTAKSITLPVATSDLGDDWTSGLAEDTDIVMSNVHPFFAGVTPNEAPSWAWNFWQTNDVVLTGSSNSKGYPNNIISEIGWPSQGGNDCGTDNGCPNATAGAVASIDNMNSFMDGWVCQSLTNGTIYFWFEAFDEPWKVVYNTATDKWESKWGLIDANRNVKDGLKIPDCGGKTVDKPY